MFGLQEGLRSADFSTTLTVFGLKPRSGKLHARIGYDLYCGTDSFLFTV